MTDCNKTIIELRKESGLSQNKFAKKFHINVQTLQKWEQGINNAPEHVVWLLQTVIDCEKQGYMIGS